MSNKISRRNFLKLAGVSAATTAVLTGCGPAARFVQREPYTKMPEYTYNGLSTYYATTCRECSAGCGLVVRTMQGRAIKVEGNPNNPVNLGKTCARGQATLEGLYNPQRVRGPIKHARGQGLYGPDNQNIESNMSWDEATQVVADALSKHQPSEIAFLLGMAPDHLFDLVTDLTKAMGAPAPVRFSALGMFEARATLLQAANDLLGQSRLPFFDIGNSDLVFSFGANFLETWLSPVAQTREYSRLRRRNPNQRGYFVQFEARLSQTGAKADEWIPLVPGTEGLVALALGRLIGESSGASLAPAYSNVDVNSIADAAGVALDTLKRLAGMFAAANHALAIPGGAALGQSNGLQTAEAVLALNAVVKNIGKDGGVFLAPLAPLADQYHRPASIKEMIDFVAQLQAGQIKVLFVHGVNPLFELPKSLGLTDALKNVSQIISFATFPDETALQADYIFPDRQVLESWGYQKIATGAGSATLSGAQPVVSGVYTADGDQPQIFYDARATADVLLAAAQKAGGALAGAMKFKDELEYIQSQLNGLLNAGDGFFSASDINTFTAYFQQNGGWWKTGDDRVAPAATDVLNQAFHPSRAQFNGDGDFFFVPFVAPVMAEAGANKPWLQEIPDPNTTVMWNTWVEINPDTAAKLGVQDNDVVSITSNAGTVEAAVYMYPAIRPDTVAMPFGQGHSAYGQFAQGRGANPADLLSDAANEAGDLAFGSMKVRVQKTGKKQQLSRLESMLGVYGFNAK
ncbi:MAG TPA: molybdopterin-dependent oxidoreductase [Anaerolineales bacterium]|nr:molybdopterin-dependent oxidoreductase [Anaerolineales bacterium]